jgi:indolepyruvate ferredoxin oxidoreductase beta subunit
MGRRLSILVAGVGGQGLITLAATLARAAVASGTKVLVAETHGLSQRGGSVEVHVRLGDVYSPLIAEGDADTVLGLELIETARRAHMVKRDGVILSADTILRPAVPGVKVPKRDELVEAITKATGVKPILVPARQLALKAGSGLYANMVMLGALASTNLLDGLVDLETLERTVSSLRRGRENLEAFRLGFNYCSGSRGG